MKSLLFTVLLLAPVLLMSQNPNKEINQLYHSVERGDDVVKLSIPGFVARSAFSISRLSSLKYNGYNDLDWKELKPIIKSIRGAQIIVIEDENKLPSKQLIKSLTNLRSKNTIEDLILVNDEGSDIDIMVSERNGKIRNLIILVAEDEELVLVNLKMKMTYETLNDFLVPYLHNEF